MKIKINDKIIEVEKDGILLDVCKKNGIKIPSLCSTEKFHEGVCRICMVEIGGRLATSCNTKVSEGMEILTESENISKARRINLELLWADHAGKCAGCKKNQRCELQNLATEQKIENFHFVPRKEEMTGGENLDLLKDNRSRTVVDESNECISRTTELCVECRRCINVCPTKEFSFNHRAGDTVVGAPFEKPLDCIFCGQCVKNCPTGAITDKNDLTKIAVELSDLKKMAVALLDPAIMESIALEQPEITSIGKLIGSLKEIGFEKVFDLGFGMELALEKMTQIAGESRKNNLLLSHCPSVGLFVKKYYPQFTWNILNIASPDDLMAQVIKNEYAKKEKINQQDIVVISISSCVAKKKTKGVNLDYVVTVRELGRMIRQKNLKLAEIKNADFDKDFMMKNEKVKNMTQAGGAAEIIATKIKCKYIVANGMSQIKNILRDLDKGRIDTKIIECMVCDGGCINGGGQSKQIQN